MAENVYQPLAANHIRLIRFSPGSDLVARLEVTALQSTPSYIALSYNWGQAPYRKDDRPLTAYSITLNEQPFEVQENLHDALQYLVPSVLDENCLLWVDAICINQNDIPERNAQILHMRYIYEHASIVFGWLGAPVSEGDIVMAVRLMRRCKVILRDGLAEHDDNMNAVATTIAPSNKDIFPEPDTDCYRGWLGIREMFKRPYWNRIWIYQEATGAAPTRFYCGNSYFDMVLVCAVVYMAHHFSEYTDINFDFRDVERGSVFAISLFRDNGKCKCGDTILELLEYLRATKSSEPRDKVYAPLGFASDFAASGIQPDYSKTLEEIYKDVVRFSLSQPSHGLQILGQVTHFAPDSNYMVIPDRSVNLPSWVPDFREYLGPNPFCPTLADGRWAYTACGPHTSHNAKIEAHRLILEGARIDEISTVSSIWETNAFSTAVVESWAPMSPDAIYAPTGQSKDEAFRTTVLADINMVTMSRGHTVDFTLLNAREDEMIATESDRRNKMNVSLKTSGVRRFGWTAKGRMGLLSPCAKVGDSLYLLCGGQVVYILRESSRGSYQYVGDAYIHGIMDGEAFGEGIEKQKITLE